MRAEIRTQVPNPVLLPVPDDLTRENRTDARLAKILGVLAIPSAVIAFAAGSPVYGLIGLTLSLPLLSPKSRDFVGRKIDMYRFTKEVKS
jgi:hypothetical protein